MSKGPPYRYSPIVEREPLRWPDDARVAFYLGLNVEHFAVDRPSTSIFQGTAHLVPDAYNYGWRDYGVRVGIWRMMELLDELALCPSAFVNAEVCRHYPQIIAEGTKRSWSWVAHGHDNSTFHAEFESEESERSALEEIFATLEEATGARPQGWLGPALTETFATPRLLAELGASYVLDWCSDDQPFPLTVDGDLRMISVPYTVELNDIPLFLLKGYTGPDFCRLVVDSLDQLYRDGQQGGRVMCVAVHPFLINQPGYHRYLEEALRYVTNHEGVWLTTSDAIAAHYYEHYYANADRLGGGGAQDPAPQ